VSTGIQSGFAAAGNVASAVASAFGGGAGGAGGSLIAGAFQQLGKIATGVANVGARASAPAAFRDGLARTRALLAAPDATPAGAGVHGVTGGRRVPLYAAASGPAALRAAGAVADGAFVNYGLQAEHVDQARARLTDGAREAGRGPDELDVWWIACLDCCERREVAFEKLGNILGFVAAYVLGPAPEARGVPATLTPAVRELRATYTTHQGAMDPGLVKRLGLFDYLRARLAIAGTPADCVQQIRAALAAGARRLMFTVSLAADPLRTVELFGREVLPAVRGAESARSPRA